MNSRAWPMALLAMMIAASASAQEAWQTEWSQTLARAKGQTLNLTTHPEDGYEQTIDEFKKKFPEIAVSIHAAAAQPTAVRIVTEQKNGVYGWDSWWAPIANMVSTLAPAQAMAPIDDYLILPEIKTLSNWNAPDYVYPGAGKMIFVHTYQQEMSIFQNASVKGSKPFTRAEDILDPVYRDNIAMREPSALNAGTLALSGLLRENDLEFIRRLFFDQRPIVINNPRQLMDSVMNGDKMIVIGGSGDVYQQCVTSGACSKVNALPIGKYVISRGVTVLKNAPHKDAVKIWVNWLLSREGQEAYVRNWAKYNRNGAASLRKDVAPHPNHVSSIPDYATLGRYTLASDSSGRDITDQIVGMYNSYKEKAR